MATNVYFTDTGDFLVADGYTADTVGHHYRTCMKVWEATGDVEGIVAESVKFGKWLFITDEDDQWNRVLRIGEVPEWDGHTYDSPEEYPEEVEYEGKKYSLTWNHGLSESEVEFRETPKPIILTCDNETLEIRNDSPGIAKIAYKGELIPIGKWGKSSAIVHNESCFFLSWANSPPVLMIADESTCVDWFFTEEE